MYIYCNKREIKVYGWQVRLAIKVDGVFGYPAAWQADDAYSRLAHELRHMH